MPIVHSIFTSLHEFSVSYFNIIKCIWHDCRFADIKHINVWELILTAWSHLVGNH